MFRTLLAAALTLAFASSASAAPIIVDTFDTPTTASVVGFGNPKTGSFAPLSGSGILGTRALSYNGGAGNFLLFEGVAVGAGSLILGTQSSAVQVNLAYSGFGTLNLTGFTSLDLIFVPIFDAGVGTFDIVVTLATSTGNLTMTFIPPGAIAPGGGVFAIPLAGLTGPGNLANVTGITLNLNDGGSPSAAADFTLSQIQFSPPVPEPATIATLGLMGLFGGYFARRKLKAGSVAQA